MSFHQDKDRSQAWKKWLERHRDELTAAGLPDWEYADEMRWLHFLEEGGLDWETGWRVEMLSPQQAERFGSFILRAFD